MPNKKLLRSRKAISPILATLLLIVIAVAAIVVTYAWIMTYMSSASQQAGVILAKANINFYTDSGTKKIDIDIRDTGTANTNIMLVYIGTSATSMQNMTITPSPPVALAAGSTVRVTITYTWTAGTIYHFKIVPSVGEALGPFQEQAPS
jgi:flagellin-like protein